MASKISKSKAAFMMGLTSVTAGVMMWAENGGKDTGYKEIAATNELAKDFVGVGALLTVASGT